MMYAYGDQIYSHRSALPSYYQDISSVNIS